MPPLSRFLKARYGCKPVQIMLAGIDLKLKRQTGECPAANILHLQKARRTVE